MPVAGGRGAEDLQPEPGTGWGLPSPLVRYLLNALAGFFGIWLLSRWFGIYPPWAAFLSIVALTIPIALAGVYGGVVKLTHGSSRFREGGWIHWWISRRGL